MLSPTATDGDPMTALHPPGPTTTPSAATPDRGLAETLRERTQALHLEAERSGIIREILRGQASRYGYALLLRNLLPAYLRLEDGLERARAAPAVAMVAQPQVYRAAALASDLTALSGPDWERELPLLPAGQRYADRVAAAAAQGDGTRLIAHAYARYLGDLNGGQIVLRLVARSLGLEAPALRFYEFPGIADLDAFKRAYRETLDAAGLAAAGTVQRVVAEARAAFRHNIAVSMAVHAAAARPDRSTAD